MVDEPDQPASSWGELTWAQVAERARAQAAGLDALGVGQGERVAVVSQNSARLLTASSASAAAGASSCRSTSGSPPPRSSYIVEHSGAWVLLVDPELDGALSGVKAEHRFVIGAETDEALLPLRRASPSRGSPTRTPPPRINYTSGTTARPKGVAAHAPQPVDQRRHVRVAHGRGRSRRLPAHAAAVPLQRLGDAVRRHRHGRAPHRAAQGGRGRDPAPGRAARRDAAVRRAGGGGGGARRRRRRGTGRSPAPARVRMVVAGAPPPTRTIERMETELGWEFVQIYGLTETAPLLTMNRGRAGVRRAAHRRSGPGELARAGAPAHRRAASAWTTRVRCWPAATS